MARARRQPAENTQPVTDEKLLKLVKSGVTSHSAAADALGVTVGQISSLAWSRALVDGGEVSEIADTAAAVKRARDVEGNRWELIAARADVSVGRVKELYGGEDAAAESVISGRRASAKTEEEETPKRGRGRPRKTETQPATTGKRATAAATPRRARTRAERRSGRSGNPS